MGFEQIDEACKAGARAEDADFATPSGSAGISPLKIAKRKIFVRFTGSNVDETTYGGSVSFQTDGVFPSLEFTTANAQYFNLTGWAPLGEISPGEPGILNIAWITAGTTGDLRLIAEIKPVIQGTDNLQTAVTRNGIQAAKGAGSVINVMKLNFPPAVLGNTQLWSLKLSRDAANSLDTLASNAEILCVWMEILGRC